MSALGSSASEADRLAVKSRVRKMVVRDIE